MRRAWVLCLLATACGATGDHLPPRILDGPSVEADDDGTAIVRWRTDERTDGVVQYGADAGYGTEAKDARYVLDHELLIAPLAPDSTFHLRLQAWDLYGNGPTLSPDVVFSTPPAPPPAQLAITEVMYAPVSKTTGQFVEIANVGPGPVDLTGFRLSDGDYWDSLQPFAGGPTELAPGSLAVVVDPDFAGDYPLPAGTTLVTASGHAICDGLLASRPLRLFTATDATTPLSTYSAEITSAPVGVSVERASPGAPDDATGWCLSPDPTGSSPGRANAGCGG